MQHGNLRLKKLLDRCNSLKVVIVKYNSRKGRAIVVSEQGVKYKASYNEDTGKWYID